MAERIRSSSGCMHNSYVHSVCNLYQIRAESVPPNFPTVHGVAKRVGHDQPCAHAHTYTYKTQLGHTWILDPWKQKVNMFFWPTKFVVIYYTALENQYNGLKIEKKSLKEIMHENFN